MLGTMGMNIGDPQGQVRAAWAQCAGFEQLRRHRAEGEELEAHLEEEGDGEDVVEVLESVVVTARLVDAEEVERHHERVCHDEGHHHLPY